MAAGEPRPVAAPDDAQERGFGRTVLAVVAAWVVPGAGHALLGRTRRAAVFAVLVWGSFALGLAHDGRLALHDERQPFLTTLQIVANAGVGPADLVARCVLYGAPAYGMALGSAAPHAVRRVEIFRDRARSAASIYGTAYLWTAGLMNLLLLFDVWDIGRGRKG